MTETSTTAPIDGGSGADAVPQASPTVVLDSVHVHYRVTVDASGRKQGKSVRGTPPGTTERRGRTELVHAVQGVTAVIHRGEAVGVVGRNGSGKSTLLRAIGGLTAITGGHVWASSTPTLLGVSAALMSDLSGARNIQLGCLAMGMPRREIKERMQDIVDFAGIGEAINRPMRTYSSGMAARLRFAIATARTPEILLVDEALNTGDADFKERSEERIRQLRGEAGTVVLVSHTLGAILDTCSRVLWMDAGVLHMDGPADEVVKAYRAYNNAVKRWRDGGKTGERPPLPGPVVGVDAGFAPVIA